MKKKIMLMILLSSFFFTGCFKNNDEVSKFVKKVDKAKSYYLSGELEIINNEDTYYYDVKVSYKDKDYYKVSLKNKTNDHEQIILKNTDGVYVLTPSLNKSFKFTSEWPHNNSQSYLLQSLVSDIEDDKTKTVKKEKNNTIVTTKVNYSNNKKLNSQKIYLKSSMVEKVEVYDKDNNVKIKMTFKNIDLKAKYKKDYFDIKSNMNVKGLEETSKSLKDIVYPMYMPKNTYLASEDKVSTENGERAILTFLGDSPFTIIEETVSVSNEIETVNMYGEPTLLVDTVGSLSDSGVTWISNGIEYYATSEVMNETELLDVIKSISAMPVSK